MGLSIERAEKLLDDLATQEEFLCKRADDASGYTRSGNKSIRTSYAKTHEQNAKEYRQILRYLAEYRLMQSDYEARLRADMVAMLTDIQREVNKIFISKDNSELFRLGQASAYDKCEDLIQQKINVLKLESGEKK